jgi:hypothetical protein
VSRLVDEILKSIIEEFAAPGMSKEDLEQKTLFRLLNYCPPPEVPSTEKPAARD